MNRLSGAHPASGKQDSSRVDQWGATCSPMDIRQNVHVGSRAKGSKWRIMSLKEFIVSGQWQRDQYPSGDVCH